MRLKGRLHSSQERRQVVDVSPQDGDGGSEKRPAHACTACKCTPATCVCPSSKPRVGVANRGVVLVPRVFSDNKLLEDHAENIVAGECPVRARNGGHGFQGRLLQRSRSVTCIIARRGTLVPGGRQEGGITRKGAIYASQIAGGSSHGGDGMFQSVSVRVGTRSGACFDRNTHNVYPPIGFSELITRSPLTATYSLRRVGASGL